jgi:hypothetical protein
LGIGPSRFTIKAVFGSTSNFYKDTGSAETHRIGTFDSWSLDDFLTHIQQVGGQRRPTREQLDKIAEGDPSRPTACLMHERFIDIGGFKGLLEKAGYPVIDLWEPVDFIDWGARFMRANQDLLPQALMMDFLSTKKLGPSAPTTIKKFDRKFRNYQKEVIRRYESGGYDYDEDRDRSLVLGEEYEAFRENKRQKDKERHAKNRTRVIKA